MINYALSKLKRNGKGKVNCRFLAYGCVSITTLTSIRSCICDMGPHRPQSEPVPPSSTSNMKILLPRTIKEKINPEAGLKNLTLK